MGLESARDFKLFSYRLFIFLITVIFLDQLCGHFLRILYFKQNHGSNYKVIYSFDKVKSKILIIGSSRAKHHYISQVFEDTLQLSSYNAGLGGNHIFYYDAVLKCSLERYTPQIIILDLSQDELERHTEYYDRLSTLLPFYSTKPQIRNLIFLKSPYERVKLLSSIYPFNSLIIESLTSTIDIHNKRFNEERLKGFIPLLNIHKEKISSTSYTNSIDSNCVNTLNSFVKDCVKKNIKLYIVISPCFVKYLNDGLSTLIAKNIAHKYHVVFWDYSQNQSFLNNSRLFNDPDHLNMYGASIYSKMIAEKIKCDLKNGH